MMFTLRSSLKTRILLLIGSVVVLLMLLISSVLLLKWRELIIQKETENAISISKTFSVTVIDAMIFEEKSVVQKENILDTYVDNFINSLKTVQYVALFDRNGASILQAIRHENGRPDRSTDHELTPQPDERVTQSAAILSLVGCWKSTSPSSFPANTGAPPPSGSMLSQYGMKSRASSFFSCPRPSSLPPSSSSSCSFPSIV